MIRKTIVLGLCFAVGCVALVSCSDDDPGQSTDNFDRGEMLANWADGFIVSGYEAYVTSLTSLQSATETFTSTPSRENLSTLRDAWLSANTDWQKVAIYEIGKAEEITLINFTNIYPTNTADMVETIESESFDLTSISSQDEQGFPAIEYLIYGVQSSDEEIISLFTNQSSYGVYLQALSDRLLDLGELVLADWQDGYRDTFVNNDGSEATSSVNKLVNDYIFYYEKHLRAGKIGIPAGVFSGSQASEKVEGLYSGTSKVLFNTSLDAMQNFFNGDSGESLKSYLEFVNTVTEGEDLAALINVQFDLARTQAQTLPDNFSTQVENDNSAMLETYDELQKNVVNLKVDMLQALNIRVDYVDADGD